MTGMSLLTPASITLAQCGDGSPQKMQARLGVTVKYVHAAKITNNCMLPVDLTIYMYVCLNGICGRPETLASRKVN